MCMSVWWKVYNLYNKFVFWIPNSNTQVSLWLHYSDSSQTYQRQIVNMSLLIFLFLHKSSHHLLPSILFCHIHIYSRTWHTQDNQKISFFFFHFVEPTNFWKRNSLSKADIVKRVQIRFIKLSRMFSKAGATCFIHHV